jgi:S-adenosylmethionine hydrolase
MRRCITLTTDLGTSDHYVGAMKGAILSVNPEAALVDISHHVDHFGNAVTNLDRRDLAGIDPSR